MYSNYDCYLASEQALVIHRTFVSSIRCHSLQQAKWHIRFLMTFVQYSCSSCLQHSHTVEVVSGGLHSLCSGILNKEKQENMLSG